MRLNMLVSIAALLCGGMASAQNYPDRPVTLVVPAAAGGGTDILGRVLADEFRKRLHQPFVIDNKAGASGMIGTHSVAQAPADGYRLLFTYSSPIYYARHTFAKVPYDVKRDLAVISEVAMNTMMLVVNNDVPVKNMKEFIAWGRKGRGKISYGSLGTGSGGHLVAAYLSKSRDLEMTHVPYKSEAPFAQDLAAGVVPWGLGTLAPMLPLIQSGKVRPIAVLSEKRLPALPNVPTMKEEGFADPEFVTMSWFVLAAPAGTPRPILDVLEKHAREIAHSPAMKVRLQNLGMEAVGGSSSDFLRNYEATGPLIEKLVTISGARSE
ncbi:MAG: tripartite tricarboxylate transporter substrate binding protein [Ramlibacter sp.]|nr:tripartite tricarboxylate transporter substrate binding protein [Ramlibacter sp.]